MHATPPRGWLPTSLIRLAPTRPPANPTSLDGEVLAWFQAEADRSSA